MSKFRSKARKNAAEETLRKPVMPGRVSRGRMVSHRMEIK